MFNYLFIIKYYHVNVTNINFNRRNDNNIVKRQILKKRNTS